MFCSPSNIKLQILHEYNLGLVILEFSVLKLWFLSGIFDMSSGGEKKNVVVIGGGVAGSLVAKTLQNVVNVSLIDE